MRLQAELRQTHAKQMKNRGPDHVWTRVTPYELTPEPDERDET